MNQKILIVFANQPFNGADNVYNGLRLAMQLYKDAAEVKIFLVNDGVDLAKASAAKENEDEDLVGMLKELIKMGIQVEACGTCMNRCGIFKNEPYMEGVTKSTMARFSSFVLECDKVLTF